MKSLLIIGTGSIGERHLRCFLSTQRIQAAIVEPNDSLRATVAERYAVPAFASLEEALTEAPREAAVICTPAHTHIAIARQCVAAGLHVLIEKPLSTSPDGIDELQREADAAQSCLRVAYTLRSLPTFQILRDIAQAGTLGPLGHVTLVSGQDFPAARPAYASTYYARHASGGGCIQDALTHMIHTVEWIVGPVESLVCDASHQALATTEVEDTVNLITRLRGDIPASFAVNQFQAPNESFLTLHGKLGSARAEPRNQRVGTYLRGAEDWSWQQLPLQELDAGYTTQAESFLNACEGKPDNLSTLAEAQQTLRVNLAALESAKTKGRVAISH